MHAVHRVADAHRPDRVAVVGAPQRDESPPIGAPAGRLDLHRELERHLDRHRPGVREEHVRERVRGDADELLGQRHRRLVGQAAEHDVAEAVDLRVQGRVEGRVAVPVHGTPPRAHGVDRLDVLPVGVLELEHDAVGGVDRVRRRAVQRGVGVPQQPPVALDESGAGTGGRHGGDTSSGRRRRRGHGGGADASRRPRARPPAAGRSVGASHRRGDPPVADFET